MMNNILRNSHNQSYIELLKLRDYYFDYAKAYDKIMRYLNFIPAFLVVSAIILDMVLEIPSNIIDFIDIIVGLSSVIIWIIGYKINQKIDLYTEKSNSYREIYDIKVFGFPANFFYTETVKYPLEGDKELIKKADYRDKYEIWYEEIFSKPRLDKSDKQYCNYDERSNHANIICSQADNIMYGKCAYKNTVNYFKKVLYVFPL